MCKLKVSDFYYGAFLSALLNTSDSPPVLFEKPDRKERRIYSLETNQGGCYIYAKYKTKKNADTKNRWHWSFPFSADEVIKLQELHQQKANVKLALICTKKGFADSELAIVNYEDAMDCLGVNIGTKTNRIDIMTYPNKEGLRMYGSGRSDKLNGKDNTLVVPRNALATL